MFHRKPFRFPAWLFAAFSVVYSEAMLLSWTGGTPTLYRTALVLSLAAGLGAIAALFVTLFRRPRHAKIASVAISLLAAVLCTVEYFVTDAYQMFMPVTTLIAGAGGVATDFADTVISLIGREYPRILLMLLPTIVYAIFARSAPLKRHTRPILAGTVAVCYALAAALIAFIGTDTAKLRDHYTFDGAVRAFGLNAALVLDAANGTSIHSPALDLPKPDTSVSQPSETTEPTEQTDAPEPTETASESDIPIVFGVNVLDIDFAALADTTDNPSFASIDHYLAAQEPSCQNEYTGLFAGKNLIIITAEAFTAEVIDPELTPTLYRLATQGIEFTDYYQPLWGGSTSTGEFSVLTGLVAAKGIQSVNEAYEQDLFFTLGKQLQSQGYFSAAYHNNSYTYYGRNQTHTHFGYDTFMGMGNGMEAGVKNVWPESDLEMIDFTCPLYIDNQPFSIYYMTVSGHANYSLEGNMMAWKNYDAVRDLPYSETVKCYLACNLELEYAMQSLIAQLEEAGIADDTVIVLTADHYPYGLEKSSTWGNSEDYLSELRGSTVKTVVDRDRSALIIWSGSIEGMGLRVDTPTYSLDILPTLSNLFGLSFDSRIMIGRDVFSDRTPLVLWPDYSWRTDRGTFLATSGTFLPADGCSDDGTYVAYIESVVKNKIAYSCAVQDYDYFSSISRRLSPES